MKTRYYSKAYENIQALGEQIYENLKIKCKCSSKVASRAIAVH